MTPSPERRDRLRWPGPRGEGYVALQALLIALLLFGPRHLEGLPAWPTWSEGPARLAGGLLLILGGLLGALAALRLGRRLTPLPHPRDDCTLETGGAYAWVRHPIYSGLILGAIGWGLFVQGLMTLLWAAVLFGFFDIKSRREEAWLLERFPAYAAYRVRVRKLIPLLY